MTTVCEQAFSLELPGQWEPIECDEPGCLAYRETDGPGRLSVVLLSVRPMFAIADRARLLSDYASHRLKYERGRAPSLEQSAPVFETRDESFEASWQGTDPVAVRQQRHRAVLVGDVLADFCFESSLPDIGSFDELAESVLATATVSREHGNRGV